MKILILANNDIGLYNFRKELIYTLLDMGHEILLSAPYGNKIDPFTEKGCAFINTPIDRRGVTPFKDILLLCRYAKIIRKFRPNLVITYTIKPNIYGGTVCRLMRTPCASNITGLGSAMQKDSLIKKMISAMYRYACKNAGNIFFENQENASYFLESDIVSPGQVCVLNGAGVNLDEYLFSPYPSCENGPRFLFSGRIMKEKGVVELIKAAVDLKMEFPYVQFDVIGPAEDNDGLIRQIKETGAITYYGFQENVKPFIEACHCFVLPSYHEGMSNSILEAGAMGRPLIVSDIPGCAEAVRESVNGYLCKPGDALSLYNALRKFILTDSPAKIEMGIQSRRHIAEKFDRQVVVDRTLRTLGLWSDTDESRSN